MLRAFAHDRFTFPVPDRHRFPLSKYGLVRALVEANPDVAVQEGPPATWDDVARVHHPEWVRRVRYGLLDRRELAGLGLPWSPALVTRTLHSCGSTTAAARASLEEGVAAALGGGMHHAGHRVGRGYCTFNDVAIAIATLRAEGCAARVLILDLDVHQGDGNAELYAGDRDTVVVSIHGARNYPFTRPPSDLDVDLPDGTGDDAYLAALDGRARVRAGPRPVRPGGADRRRRPVRRRRARPAVADDRGARRARPAGARRPPRRRHPGLRHARGRLRTAARGRPRRSTPPRSPPPLPVADGR